MIAFLGSVFSPYYAWARAAGGAEPLDHCAINVALYGGRERRWCMTERGQRRVDRSSCDLAIGPSRLEWDGTALKIHIDERGAPLPRRVRGIVTVHPTHLSSFTTALDAGAHHHWGPIAPSARVEVALDSPDLRWSGSGYVDSNTGDEALEDSFTKWTWSRTDLGTDGAAILYDVTERGGRSQALALRFRKDGAVETFEPPPLQRLPMTGWRIQRETRADPDLGARVVRTLEDGPFYARSHLETGLFGRLAPAMHESLSLDRFRALWVRLMLPFRMPRAVS